MSKMDEENKQPLSIRMPVDILLEVRNSGQNVSDWLRDASIEKLERENSNVIKQQIEELEKKKKTLEQRKQQREKTEKERKDLFSDLSDEELNHMRKTKEQINIWYKKFQNQFPDKNISFDKFKQILENI